MAGDHQVRHLIAVEVLDDERPRRGADGEHARGLEGPIAIAEQDGHGVVHVVADGQILLVVAIEIADDEADRAVAHVKACGALKVPLPLPSNSDTVFARSG